MVWLEEKINIQSIGTLLFQSQVHTSRKQQRKLKSLPILLRKKSIKQRWVISSGYRTDSKPWKPILDLVTAAADLFSHDFRCNPFLTNMHQVAGNYQLQKQTIVCRWCSTHIYTTSVSHTHTLQLALPSSISILLKKINVASLVSQVPLAQLKQ